MTHESPIVTKPSHKRGVIYIIPRLLSGCHAYYIILYVGFVDRCLHVFKAQDV